MLLRKELPHYRAEIARLYELYLDESLPSGGTFFAHIQNGVLQGVASVRCYPGGHWLFRGCVVKPEFRGRGLQRQLMREGIEYLTSKGVDVVRGCIYSWNTHSIDNTLAMGFRYEKDRKLPNGKMIGVYALRLPHNREEPL